MTDVATNKRPWHLWVVGILSLLWNAMGALDYTMTQTRNAEWLSAMSTEQMDWINSFPAWAEGAWAIGVWMSVAGSILLLFRSRMAATAFAVSLLGVLGTTIFQYGLSDAPDSFRTPGSMAFSAAIWIVAILLLIYSVRMRRRGVLH